jgi:hypothetical protein
MVVFVLVGRFLRALYSLAKHAESRPISAYERLSKRAVKDANQRKAQISGEAAKFNARGWPQESSERRWQGQWCYPNRFRFLNAERFGTILAMKPFAGPFPSSSQELGCKMQPNYSYARKS